MAGQYRAASGDSGSAYYQPVSQDEAGIDGFRSPPALDIEDEEAAAEEFVSQEHVAQHDRRIYWIHIMLGCAVLLPWNGRCSLCKRN
jgi:hypothetical protein